MRFFRSAKREPCGHFRVPLPEWVVTGARFESGGDKWRVLALLSTNRGHSCHFQDYAVCAREGESGLMAIDLLNRRDLSRCSLESRWPEAMRDLGRRTFLAAEDLKGVQPSMNIERRVE